MESTVPDVLGVIAEDEAQLMASLSTSQEIQVIDPDLDVIWEQLSLCLRVHCRAEAIALKLRPLIGRYLLAARDNPSIYQSHGFLTYSEFIRVYVCGLMKLSRSALYEVRMIAERLPSLTPDQYQELGPTKAMTLAKFSRSSDPSFQKNLDEARNRTANEFIAWAEEQNLLTAGEQQPAVLVIQGDRLLIDLWNEFICIAEVQSFVGSANPSSILKSMIAECRSTWVEYQRVE